MFTSSDVEPSAFPLFTAFIVTPAARLNMTAMTPRTISISASEKPRSRER